MIYPSWCNYGRGLARVREWLDRALGNSEWITTLLTCQLIGEEAKLGPGP